MRAVIAILIGLVFLVNAAGCRQKPEVNRVDLDQINVDDSNNYRYIFRETIREERERENREKKKEF
ncbi:MAG: hypothetical protein JXA07_06410 [Spirochaetes bacterium]|nr:hypothetical protein [Spirochaetota bacterium]